MKRFKEIFIGLVIIAAVFSLVVFIYRNESSKYSRELARRINEISPRGGAPETIDGLRQAIALYEDQIERNVREGVQTGVYWKILGTRLADRSMHNEALDAFERAIYFNSEDPVLFYLTGVSAGIVAKSIVGFSVNSELEREHFFSLSENSYLRAIELDITYARAMYGLAVLYVFELDRIQDAIIYLERYLQINPSDNNAIAVLARANFMLGNLREAVELYDRIAARTRDQKMKEEALENREFIMRLIYE